MSTADEVIAALEQAKAKLADAKSKGLQGVTMYGKASHSVGHVLGRAGAGSPLLAQLRAKEKEMVQSIMAIDALSARIDKAIGQAKAAAGSKSVAGAEGGGTAPA